MQHVLSLMDGYKASVVPIKHVTVPAGLVVPSFLDVWKLSIPETERVVTPLVLPAEVTGRQVACPYKIVANKV